MLFRSDVMMAYDGNDLKSESLMNDEVDAVILFIDGSPDFGYSFSMSTLFCRP